MDAQRLANDRQLINEVAYLRAKTESTERWVRSLMAVIVVVGVVSVGLLVFWIASAPAVPLNTPASLPIVNVLISPPTVDTPITAPTKVPTVAPPISGQNAWRSVTLAAIVVVLLFLVTVVYHAAAAIHEDWQGRRSERARALLAAEPELARSVEEQRAALLRGRGIDA